MVAADSIDFKYVEEFAFTAINVCAERAVFSVVKEYPFTAARV